MEKILTAMGTTNLINRLENNIDFLVYEKDIPYREGIIELLKQDDKFNIVIINEDLPGQINLEDLIKNIKLINEKINIIFFIEKNNNVLEKNLNSKNIKFFYKDKFNWNEFILYIKNINKKLDEEKNSILNENKKINNKKNIIINKNEKINNEENMTFNNGKNVEFYNEKINNKEKKNLYNSNDIKNNIENKKLTSKSEIKNMQNKYLINNKQKEINNFNTENKLIDNKLNNEKMKNKNSKLNSKEIKEKDNNETNNSKIQNVNEVKNNKHNRKEKNNNKKENKITVISEIEKNEINMILDKYIKRLNSISKIYYIKFNKINKNIKYSEKIIFVATTEFEDVKKINNSIINIQNKYNIESEKINILFIKKKSNFVNITLLKNLFKKYKVLKK